MQREDYTVTCQENRGTTCMCALHLLMTQMVVEGHWAIVTVVLVSILFQQAFDRRFRLGGGAGEIKNALLYSRRERLGHC